jgi:hypothetical protein
MSYRSVKQPRVFCAVLWVLLASGVLSLVSTQRAHAQVTVTAPTSGSVVNSPVLLQAQASNCQSQPTASMAYSIDDGSDNPFGGATSINQNATISLGSHTVRVKAWGNNGGYCEKDVALNVGGGAAVTTPVNGSYVSNPFNLQASAPSCGGQSTASMAYSLDGQSDNPFNATSINTSVSTTTGAHLLRVKAWGNSGAYCETDLSINVAGVVAVNTPSNNSNVTSPFTLEAQSSACQSHPTTSMTYSLDGGADNPPTYATSLNTSVTAGTGSHILHVKAWGNQGALCESDVNINVVAPAITISSPTGTNVTSPFSLQAQSTNCNSQSTVSMADSIDSGTDTVFRPATSINTPVSAATGAHVLHVKAWDGSGDLCEQDMDINVINNGLQPPSNAAVDSNLELNGTYTGTYLSCTNSQGDPGDGGAQPGQNTTDPPLWLTQRDCGTAGTKSGSTSQVSTPTHSGDTQSREFMMTYSGAGAGVRWFDGYSADSVSTHFQYDAWVYIQDITQVMNIEMDFNQAVDSSHLYVFGIQCNLSGGYWQSSPNGASWQSTNQTCQSSQFNSGTWHHVQIQYHRGPNSGDLITYDAVAVDGLVSNFTCGTSNTACTGSPANASWSHGGPNFQLDGLQSSGSITAYVDDFTIYRW